MPGINRPVLQNRQEEQEEMSYVTHEQLKEECDKINERIDEVTDNHLPHLFDLVDQVLDKVNTLKWVVVAGAGVISIVLAMLHVFA